MRRDGWQNKTAEERRHYRPSESLDSSPWRTMLMWIFDLWRSLRGSSHVK
jgi:hypothetical protein